MAQNSVIDVKYFNQQMLDEIIKNNSSFTFSIKSNNFVVENFKKTIKYLALNNYNFNSKQIIVKLDATDNYLNKNQINELKSCNDLINLQGGSLAVNDGNNDLWSIENIIFANNRIDSAVNTINNLRVPDENNRPLNNLEKLLFAYEICRSLSYNENSNNKMHARTITSVLNDGRDIVCVGYASLFQELCTRLNIKCYKHFCKVDDANTKGEEGLHVNNVVVVNNKIFYNDVCWDSVKKDDLAGKYNFFMLPYIDKNKMENSVKTLSDLSNTKDPFVDIINDKKLLNLALINEQKLSDQLKNQLVDVRLKYSDEFSDVEYFDEEFSDLEIKNSCKNLLDKLNEYKVDSSLPLELLEKSLYNLSRACGETKENASQVSKRTIEYNKARAATIFKDGAVNSLFKAYQENNKECISK